ncbi:MAG TPA: DUF2304 family protein [Desulfobacterales bacterium]|nr:DUF2304 family protein [Desulfobacterales bacterium]
MDIAHILSSVLYFISKWVGTTAPRILVAFFGLLCAIMSIVFLWDRRIKTIVGATGVTIGLLMVMVALEPGIIHFLVQTSYFTRVRFLMTALSFMVIVTTIEAIRRSHLQERYAILWIATSLIILATAFFPRVLDFLRIILGTDYVAAVVGIVFIFLLLIAFHFSISLSTYWKNQAQIAQRQVLLEERVRRLTTRLEGVNSDVVQKKHQTDPFPVVTHLMESDDETETHKPKARLLRGSQIAVPLIITGITLSVLIVGWLTPRPMVGDEVTHFYMLSKQADYLSKPNFYADIPTNWGATEVRRYPHSFLWHYIGAVLYRLTGKSFYILQLYQTLFWAQLLIFAYLLAKSRNGIENRSVLLYVILISSLPVAIIFSITFYQDVPMTAQVFTAFYFLRHRRWFLGTLFLCLAIGFKVNALLFVPAFLILLAIWEFKSSGWVRSIFRLACSIFILFSFTWTMGKIVETHAGTRFYPEIKLHQLMTTIKRTIKHTDKGKKGISRSTTPKSDSNVDLAKKTKPVTRYEIEIIANHPGDLRIPENHLVYGGVILWIVLLAGTASFFCARFGMNCSLAQSGSTGWLFGAGLSYILLTAFYLRTAPDARFFLPGVLFVILPFVEHTVRLPRPKLIIATISALAVLQGGYVLNKTYKLRHVSPQITAAIEYLEENEPSPRTVFMYPEGNYRLFPVPHEWYLDYRLREFWRADNDARIQMLHRMGIGAVVIKKHLIAEVDPEIINLGVYPTFFVEDLRKDDRFEKVFENEGVIIFKVPPIKASSSG